MFSNRYQVGLSIQRKQFENALNRGKLPIAWNVMLNEPLNLYSVRRISANYAIGIVRHFSMTQRFHVNLFPDDIRMLEAAQEITLAVGDVWKPDNKYIDCEVNQYIAHSEYSGYFNSFKYVEPKKHLEVTHYAKPQRVYWNHEDWYLVSSTRETVNLTSVEFDETITVSRAEFGRTDDYLGFDSIPMDTANTTTESEDKVA